MILKKLVLIRVKTVIRTQFRFLLDAPVYSGFGQLYCALLFALVTLQNAKQTTSIYYVGLCIPTPLHDVSSENQNKNSSFKRRALIAEVMLL